MALSLKRKRNDSQNSSPIPNQSDTSDLSEDKPLITLNESGSEDDDDDLSGPLLNSDNGSSKRRKSNNNPINDVAITYYCNVLKEASHTGKGKAKAKKPEYVEKLPFALPSSAPYSSLVIQISQRLPCSVLSVPEAEIRWRKAIPKNGDAVLLGGEVGYANALIPKLSTARVGEREVHLYMPKPVAAILVCLYLIYSHLCSDYE